MKSSLLSFFLLPIMAFSQGNPEKLPRSESFFGLHFDLHANTSIMNAGEHLTESMVDSMLKMVQPDYIQVDCKGHGGVSSYPTKVGTPLGGFVKDPMRIYRDATEKNNLALYVHFSGVYDSQVCQDHPDWEQIGADGKPYKGRTSLFSPYVDQYLIPQIKELIDEYDIDGAWIDGECWALQTDYNEMAQEAFEEATGIDDIPTDTADEHMRAYMDFQRDKFRSYLKHYADAIHAHDPEFQLTSNWAYSSMMPEPVDAPLDFLSGDISPLNSVNDALLQARCLASQGKPWDLMAWSFGRTFSETFGGHVPKNTLMLKQECAEIISMGGGVSLYYKQNRDLSLQPWRFGQMKELAEFCRSYQEFCHKSEAVHQIVVYYSTEGFKSQNSNIYRMWDAELTPLIGTLRCLMDGQHSVEVMMDHHLKNLGNGIMDIPVIVVPEWKSIDLEIVALFKQYVKQGGNLILAGPHPVHIFKEMVNAELEGQPEYSKTIMGYDQKMTTLWVNVQKATANDSNQVLSHFYNWLDYRFPARPAALLNEHAQGMVGSLLFDLGTRARYYYTPMFRDLLGQMINEMVPRPMVKVEGSHLVHVVLRKKNDRTYLHLINSGGLHSDYNTYVFDEIPPVGPLTITLDYSLPVREITLLPEGRLLSSKIREGKRIFTIDKLDIYSIIEIK